MSKNYKLLCTKCGCEIKGGFFNYPSGVQCAKCGDERAPLVERALNEEFQRMAKELKEHKRLL